jgi:hypothetical protein
MHQENSSFGEVAEVPIENASLRKTASMAMMTILDDSQIKYFIVLALMHATLGVFGNSLTSDFVNYDDSAYVTANEHVKQGFTAETVVWAFTTTTMGNWNPITWPSHMSDLQLYGLNPTGHRLTNVFFHSGSTILLFILFQRMTGCLWSSAAVAALFAVHPLRVESVVWISERKNVLSTFLFLMTLFGLYQVCRAAGHCAVSFCRTSIRSRIAGQADARHAVCCAAA